MADRREAAEEARSPCDLGSKIGGGKTESYLEMTGDLAPVYQEEGGQGLEGLSRSEETWSLSGIRCSQLRCRA
jgi:hypothetical protein